MSDETKFAENCRNHLIDTLVMALTSVVAEEYPNELLAAVREHGRGLADAQITLGDNPLAALASANMAGLAEQIVLKFATKK